MNRNALKVRKMKFAALLVTLLAWSIAPAASAEIATPDDTARFLAGLSPSPDSPLVALTKDASWQQHANYFNSIFGQQERNHLAKVRAFSKARLGTTHDTMLYMFSGPTPCTPRVFPERIQLRDERPEPAGDIPPLTSLPRGTVQRRCEISRPR
jgi:hypothetical protein